MKKLIPIILLSLLIVGCTANNTPRQAVVEAFPGADIVEDPSSESNDYLAKNMDGSIWHVSIMLQNSTNGYGYYIQTKTLVFRKLE